MQLNDLRVNLTLDNTGFRLSVADSGRILRQFEQTLTTTGDRMRRLEGNVQSFGQRVQNFVHTLGMARFAFMDLNDIFLSFPKAVLRTSGEIERMTKLMEGLSDQSDAAAKRLEAVSNVKLMFNMAQSAPFEVKALTDAFIKFKTGGIDPTNGSLQALINGVARFGGSSEQLHRASIAIQQMGGKGVVSMEELRQQLGEAVPTAMKAMADGMNMTMAELTNAVSKGTVESSLALRKMLIEMGIANYGAAAAMMDTWTGMTERLKTQWELFKLQVGEAGFFDTTKKELQSLIDLLASEEAGSFGRDLGRSMDDVAKAIVSAVRKAVEFGDVLQTIGKIWAMWFVASKLSGPLMSAWGGVKKLNEAAEQSRRATIAETTARRNAARQAIADDAQRTRARIEANNQIIAAERQVTTAQRAQEMDRLRENIRTNEAIVSNHRRMRDNLRAAEAAYRNNPAVVRAGVAGLATDADRDTARRLRQELDVAQHRVNMNERDYRLRQAQIVADRQHLNLLRNGTAAMTERAAAARSENALLRATLVQQEQQIRNITRGNMALAQMRNIGATVGRTMLSIATSAYGIQAAIVVAALAWDHFADKARRAEAAARAAIDLQKKTKEGSVEAEDVENARKQNSIRNQRIQDNNDRLRVLERTPESHRTQKTKERITQLKAENERLVKEIAATEKDLTLAMEVTFTKEAERRAATIRSKIDQEEKDVVQPLVDARAKVDKAWEERIKATPSVAKNKAEVEKHQKELEAASIAVLEARRAFRRKAAERLMAEAKEAGDWNKATAKAYAIVAKESDATAGDITNEIVDRQRPNEFLAKPTKPKQKAEMDGVLQAINQERLKGEKAQTAMNGLLEDVLDIGRLQQDFRNEIAAINENDADKKIVKKHNSADEQELIDLKTRNAVIDRLKQLYGGLAKRRLEVMEEYNLSVQKMQTGNFQLQGEGPAQRVVRQLEEELRIAEERAKKIPGEVENIKKALADARAIVNAETYTAGADIFARNREAIESLLVGTLTNEKSRLVARQAQETRALRQRYEAQFALVSKNEAMLNALREQYRQEDLLLAQRHANEMRTPLERLAESWSDVTKNMEDATSRWAEGAIEAFVNTAATGKLSFSDFATSVIKDLLRIQLQASLSSSMSTLMKGFSTFLGGFMGGGSAGVSISAAALNSMPLNFPAANTTGFANGGIMTQFGPLPLKKYSMGGIATSPQLALFGEGRMNEAYVPLPDGRTIPVTLNGSAAGAPSVTVNVVNQSGTAVQAEAGEMRFDGRGYILDVVMTAATTPGSFRNSLKQALK